jgi:hypothetical protein
LTHRRERMHRGFPPDISVVQLGFSCTSFL